MNRRSWPATIVVLAIAVTAAACGGGGAPAATGSVSGNATSLATTSVAAAPIGTCATYPRGGFIVEGPVVGTGDVPASAAAYVIWVVTSGDDDTATFGRGCVDAAAGRFVIALDQDPPPKALNDWRGCTVGVGTVLLVEDEFAPDVDPIAAVEAAGEIGIGASDGWAVVFTSGPCDTVGWPGAFAGGYALGRCEAVPDDFDVFEPASPDYEPVLRVADLDDIVWCNWT